MHTQFKSLLILPEDIDIFNIPQGFEELLPHTKAVKYFMNHLFR